jgi:hypothetical protein
LWLIVVDGFQVPQLHKHLNVSGYISATFLKFNVSTTINLMRSILPILAFIVVETLLGSCKKQENKAECFPGVATVRQITDKPAVIKVTATVNAVYLVELGAIDTKLIPCNLPKEFMQNDLPVIISGNVKATVQGTGLCCSEDFVITKITR